MASILASRACGAARRAASAIVARQTGHRNEAARAHHFCAKTALMQLANAFEESGILGGRQSWRWNGASEGCWRGSGLLNADLDFLVHDVGGEEAGEHDADPRPRLPDRHHDDHARRDGTPRKNDHHCETTDRRALAEGGK